MHEIPDQQEYQRQHDQGVEFLLHFKGAQLEETPVGHSPNPWQTGTARLATRWCCTAHLLCTACQHDRLTRHGARRAAPRSPPRSAAQPAASSNVVLRPATPRINAIFGNDASAEAALQEVLEKIRREFLFGKVAAVRPDVPRMARGSVVEAEVPRQKLEEFLRVVEQQRANHPRRTPGLHSDEIFTNDDMQKIHSEWMNDYRSWMNAEKVQEYERWRNGTDKGDQQKARQFRRTAFSAYLFQIIGNKHVLLSAIQHPICSAAQPADAIRRFMNTWEMWTAAGSTANRIGR